MSWNDVFPILGNEEVLDYFDQRTEEESRNFEEWFGVASVHPPIENSLPSASVSNGDGSFASHMVTCCLFWKNIQPGDVELPAPRLEMLVDARRLGLVRRFDPWETYVAPMLVHGPEIRRQRPDTHLRVYLASDLEFLIPMLNEAGWEVFLMKSPSIRYCPGGFWRFLALEEDRLVTVVDADRMGRALGDMVRTDTMHQLGLGLWRVPGYYNADYRNRVRYRPILGGHFGARGGLPVRALVEAFVWSSMRGRMNAAANIPGIGRVPIQFALWPGYGFDEWFLMAVLYPYLVSGGTLSFVPAEAKSMLLALDLEYALRANGASDTVVF